MPITSERILVEEINIVSGTWDHEADWLHWAREKFYGFIHAQENGLKKLVIQLVQLELYARKVIELRQKSRQDSILQPSDPKSETTTISP